MKVSKGILWLALVAIAAAVAIGANVVLLGAAEPRDDPVGKLSRQIVLARDGEPAEAPAADPGAGPATPSATDAPGSSSARGDERGVVDHGDGEREDESRDEEDD